MYRYLRAILMGASSNVGVFIDHKYAGTDTFQVQFKARVGVGISDPNILAGTIYWLWGVDNNVSSTFQITSTGQQIGGTYTYPVGYNNTTVKTIKVVFTKRADLVDLFYVSPQRDIIGIYGSSFNQIALSTIDLFQQKLAILPTFKMGLTYLNVQTNNLGFQALDDAFSLTRSTLVTLITGSQITGSAGLVGQTVALDQDYDLRAAKGYTALKYVNVGYSNVAPGKLRFDSGNIVEELYMQGNKQAAVPYLPPTIKILKTGLNTSVEATDARRNIFTTAFNPAGLPNLLESYFYNSFPTAQKQALKDTINYYWLARNSFTNPGTKVLDISRCASISTSADAQTYGYLQDLIAMGWMVNYVAVA